MIKEDSHQTNFRHRIDLNQSQGDSDVLQELKLNFNDFKRTDIEPSRAHLFDQIIDRPTSLLVITEIPQLKSEIYYSKKAGLEKEDAHLSIETQINNQGILARVVASDFKRVRIFELSFISSKLNQIDEFQLKSDRDYTLHQPLEAIDRSVLILASRIEQSQKIFEILKLEKIEETKENLVVPSKVWSLPEDFNTVDKVVFYRLGNYKKFLSFKNLYLCEASTWADDSYLILAKLGSYQNQFIQNCFEFMLNLDELLKTEDLAYSSKSGGFSQLTFSQGAEENPLHQRRTKIEFQSSFQRRYSTILLLQQKIILVLIFDFRARRIVKKLYVSTLLLLKAIRKVIEVIPAELIFEEMAFDLSQETLFVTLSRKYYGLKVKYYRTKVTNLLSESKDWVVEVEPISDRIVQKVVGARRLYSIKDSVDFMEFEFNEFKNPKIEDNSIEKAKSEEKEMKRGDRDHFLLFPQRIKLKIEKEEIDLDCLGYLVDFFVLSPDHLLLIDLRSMYLFDLKKQKIIKLIKSRGLRKKKLIEPKRLAADQSIIVNYTSDPFIIELIKVERTKLTHYSEVCLRKIAKQLKVHTVDRVLGIKVFGTKEIQVVLQIRTLDNLMLRSKFCLLSIVPKSAKLMKVKVFDISNQNFSEFDAKASYDDQRWILSTMDPALAHGRFSSSSVIQLLVVNHDFQLCLTGGFETKSLFEAFALKWEQTRLVSLTKFSESTHLDGSQEPRRKNYESQLLTLYAVIKGGDDKTEEKGKRVENRENQRDKIEDDLGMTPGLSETGIYSDFFKAPVPVKKLIQKVRIQKKEEMTFLEIKSILISTKKDEEIEYNFQLDKIIVLHYPKKKPVIQIFNKELDLKTTVEIKGVADQLFGKSWKILNLRSVLLSIKIGKKNRRFNKTYIIDLDRLEMAGLTLYQYSSDYFFDEVVLYCSQFLIYRVKESRTSENLFRVDINDFSDFSINYD